MLEKGMAMTVRSMSCRGAPWLLPWVAIAAVGCGDSSRDREVGQTEFESAPPVQTVGLDDGADGGAGNPDSGGKANGTARALEETDLYRLEGNRLYYLNGYRGLMVFDVQDVDHPKLLGRSPIFGQPIDMIVRDGIATVVIGDWYGAEDDGTPFHGSVVRGLDAKDPANIRVLGEAKLGGWVRDDRVVGDVIYAVSQDYGWSYGWGYDDVAVASDGSSSSSGGASVIVSSVSFAGGKITAIDRYEVPGYSGVFHVTPKAILLASSDAQKTELRYLDISDPAGDIAPRGTIHVPGIVNGWGADNGRWNLDFADGTYAHAIAMNYTTRASFTLSTVNFANPDAPTLASTLDIPGSGWAVAARFVDDRLYLSPDSSYYQSASTPLQIYDLSTPTAPRLAGTSQVAGTVWNLLPAPSNRLFALGNTYNTGTSAIALNYLDVANPAAPQLLGTSTFGQGWGWTPAAGTFKAFTLDAARGLAVLPYSSWDGDGARYRNGLQLVELTANALSTAGMAQTKGWVERGIFVGERLVSLSDLALSVIDYSNRQAPRVVNELTLARNVVATLPTAMGVAEVSSDWWDYDSSRSLIRMLPKAQAEESADLGAVPSIEVEGVNARVFANGQLLYVLTSLRCPPNTLDCTASAQLQVVDFSSGAPVLRGKLALPNGSSAPWGWGWYGFWWYDWWGGDSVAQVENDALAVRKWTPTYDSSGKYTGSDSELIVLDLANADAPRVASTVVQNDVAGWWGNLKVVGSTLYTTEYEWVDEANPNGSWVRYYLDAIDLSDRAHPRVKTHINVPGILVGGDASDPEVIYTMDYRWDGDAARNDFDVLRVRGHKASLLSHTRLRGWVGQSFVVGTTVYVSTQVYEDGKAPRVELHAIDASNTRRPVDRVVRDNGWGWLLAIVGDRALVTSGWGSSQAIDVYLLRDGQAPKFEQTVRSRGWSLNGVARDGDVLYLASGYWGVQRIAL